MEPIISVLIPVYNVEKYLERCLDSICNQTMKEIEIIIVDDGSTDRSGEIIKEYANHNKNIIHIHQKNGGESSARNAAIPLAKGKYISFVDSDDWIAENMLETLYKHAEKENADIVMCNIIRAVNSEQLDPTKPIKEYTMKANPENISEICYQLLYEENGASLCNKLYRATFMKQFNGGFGDVQIGTDLTFNLKLLMYMPKISVIDQNLYYYFVNTTSVTHKYAQDQMKQFANIMAEVTVLADANGISENIKKFLPLIAFRGFTIVLYNSYKYNNGILFLRSKIKEMMSDEMYYKWIKQGVTSQSTSLIKDRYNKIHVDIVFFLLLKRGYTLAALIEWVKFFLVTSKRHK